MEHSNILAVDFWLQKMNLRNLIFSDICRRIQIGVDWNSLLSHTWNFLAKHRLSVPCYSQQYTNIFLQIFHVDTHWKKQFVLGFCICGPWDLNSYLFMNVKLFPESCKLEGNWNWHFQYGDIFQFISMFMRTHPKSWSLPNFPLLLPYWITCESFNLVSNKNEKRNEENMWIKIH